MARDIQVSPATIKNWIGALENLYIVFTVTPFSKNIARAILKEPKVYFYDCALVQNGKAAVFENLVALSLRKQLHFLQDTKSESNSLHCVRDKEKREADFILIRDKKPVMLVEAKLSDENPSRFAYFKKYFPEADFFQLVCELDRAMTIGAVQIAPAAYRLSQLSI